MLDLLIWQYGLWSFQRGGYKNMNDQYYLFFQILEILERRNGNLFPRLFRPSVRKNCSSGREKLLKFEAEDRDFTPFEKAIQTVKGQTNF